MSGSRTPSGASFSGMVAERKLTKNELIREIREMICSEYEAIKLYTQLAESTDDAVAKAVLLGLIYWVVYATASADTQPFIYFQF